MILYNKIQKLQEGSKFINRKGIEMQLKDYANSIKDKKELITTGQIRTPRSIQYIKNIKPQADIKQDYISAEQRNAPLNPLQRPLIYLANPEKVLGDLGVPGMETSELDRQAVVANRLNPYQSGIERLKNKAKLGLGYVPRAALNTAMAAAFMPEGSGALGLINETLNPLAGITKNISEDVLQKVTYGVDNLGGIPKKSTLEKTVHFLDEKLINPIVYRKEIKDIKEFNKLSQELLQTSEGRRRLSNSLGISSDNLDFPQVTFNPRKISAYDPVENAINMNMRQISGLEKKGLDLSPRTVFAHEKGHWLQREADKNSKNYIGRVNNYNKNPTSLKKYEYPIPRSNPTDFEEYAQHLYGIDPKTKMMDIPLLDELPGTLGDQFFVNRNANYFAKGNADYTSVEPTAFFREMRQNMINKGYIKNQYDDITGDLIKKFMEENPRDRVSSFTSPTNKNLEGLSHVFRNLPAILPIAGATYLTTRQEQRFQKGGILQFKKQPFRLQNQYNTVSRDATSIPKQQARPLQQLNVRNKTDKEIAQEREARIQASIEAQKTPYTKENWRQQLASETAATGDKLRVSNSPNFFDDHINPAAMIGSMASGLGQAPLQAQQSDSALPYVTAIGAPLFMGAVGGLGANTTAKFANNVINPMAGTGSIIKGLKNKIVSKALGSSNNKAFLEKYLTSPKKGKILLPSGNKDLKKIPLGGGPSKPLENTLWVVDAAEDVDPIISSRIRYDDLSSLMEKQGKNFSKKYGTKYTEKDLGLYAKMEAINKNRLQTQSHFSMGTDIEVSDKFIDKHGIARQYEPMDELLTDAYTQGYDSRINNRVNQHEAEASTAFYKKEVAPKLEELIKKNKLKSPEVLHRGEADYALKKVWRDGVKQPNGSVKYSELQKGDVFKPGSFLSTSISRQNADNFGKLSSEITAPAGQSILFPNATGVRNYFPEKEVLLPRKLKYRVDDIVEKPLGGRNIDGTPIVSRLFKHSIVNPYTTVGAVVGTSMINKNK